MTTGASSVAGAFSTVWIFAALLALLGAFLVVVYRKFLTQGATLRENATVYLSGLAFLFLAYGPILFSRHVYWDDYQIWVWDRQDLTTHPAYLFIYSIGRPLANLYLFPLFSLVDSLEAANLARFLSLILTSFTFFLFYKAFRFLNFEKAPSYMLSLAIVSSLSFHVYNYWLLASYIPVGIILALFSFSLAGLIFREISEPSISSADTDTGSVKKFGLSGRHWSLILLSSLTLILSLATYQPAAGFFPVLTAILILKEGRQDRIKLKRILTIFGTVYLVSNLFYFAAFKVFLKNFSYTTIHTSYDPRGLQYLFDTGFLWEKFLWFLHVPLPNAANPLNLWSPSLSFWFMVVFGICISVFIFQDIGGKRGAKLPPLQVGIKYTAVLLLIPISYISVLISDNYEANYRTIAPLWAFNLVVVYLALALSVDRQRFVKRSPFTPSNALLAVLCLFNLVMTQTTLGKLSEKHSYEIGFIASEIGSVPEQDIAEIRIIAPSSAPLSHHPKYDLNRYSSHPGYVFPMLSCLFSEELDPDHFQHIDLVVIQEGEEFIVRKGTASSHIQLIQQNYHGFNIVRSGQLYFAILMSEGAFEISRIRDRDYSRLFVADRREKVFEEIDKFLESPATEQPRIIEENYQYFDTNSSLAEESINFRSKIVEVDFRSGAGSN